MEIYYLGHSCFKIKGKQAVVVTDPYEEKVAKLPKDLEADVVTVSHDHGDHNAVDKLKRKGFVVDGPGEYEVSGVSVIGVAGWHDDKRGEERGNNTMYVIEMDGLRLLHLGDVGHKLSESQLEEIGAIDVVFVPVGGVYTIDAKTAVEVTRQVDPWIIVPMHYALGNNELKLGGVETFLKEMGKSEVLAIPKLVISADKLPTELQVIVLESR